ncbi:MAG: phage tail tape measure protein [Castellaniella sp.]|uniref:phage tail tape measure protein n=1 Tax=Castellaniella sp. TaxID=1955812 RepID=UPI00121585D7|nr:phage tail tape measure protein [Castellaniella sp.]TAN27276.1 MAG: phage tail tape measure protein [Castellaniella sp.]
MAADDIASLGIEIDSSQVQRAKEDLAQLAKQGPTVSQAMDRIAQRGNAAGSALRQVADQAGRAQSSLKWIMGGGALIGGASLLSVFHQIVQATQESMAAQAQLAAVLRSTGEAAGMSQRQINDLAKSLSNHSVFSGDEITQGATHLLAYSNIVGDQIPRAMQATIDTAARMGMTVVQAAETVGRALDVPSEGMASLTRQGFRFTDVEKEMVKNLEDAGRKGEAQAIILKALESSYGGAAQAARDTFGGALQSLNNAVGDLMSGQAGGGLQGLTGIVNDLNTALQSDKVPVALNAIGTAVEVVSAVIAGKLVGSLGASAIVFTRSSIAAYANAAAMTAIATASERAAVAAGVTAVAVRGLGAAVSFLTGPIGIVFTALGVAAASFATYAQQTDAASGSTRDFAASLDTSATALERMSQAQRESAAGKLRDELSQAVDEANTLNERVGLLTDWVNGHPAGDTMMSVWRRELTDLQAQTDTAGQKVVELARKLQALASFTPAAADPLVAYRTALDQYMDKYATKAEQRAKAIAKARKELGPLFNSDIEGRINDHFKDPKMPAAKTSALDSVIKKLQEEQATFDMSDAAAERYRITMTKGSDAERQRALTLFDTVQAMKDAKKQTDQAIESTRLYAAVQAEIAAFEAQKAIDVASVGLGDRLRDQLTEENQIRQQYAQRRRQLEEAQQVESTRINEEAYQKRLAILSAAEQQQVDIIRTKSAEKQAAEADWQNGAMRAIQNYQDEVNNVASATENAMTNAFRGMEDALVEFVTTGKFNITDLANSIIKDLARIAVKQAILGPLAGALGGLFSGGDIGTMGSVVGSNGLEGIATVPFAAGGYTGDGGRFQPAGIVHKGEGVLSQSEIRAIGGPAGFAALRSAIRGPGHAMGGMAGNPSRPGASSNQRPVVTVPITIVTPDANSFHKSKGQVTREIGMAVNRSLARG